MADEQTFVEIVWGSFARLDIPTARVVSKGGESLASCRHQHKTAESAYACGRTMQRRLTNKSDDAL